MVLNSNQQKKFDVLFESFFPGVKDELIKNCFLEMITKKMGMYDLREHCAFIVNRLFMKDLFEGGYNAEKAGKMTLDGLVQIAKENFGCLVERHKKGIWNWGHTIQNQDNAKTLKEDMSLGAMTNLYGGKTRYMKVKLDNTLTQTNIPEYYDKIGQIIDTDLIVREKKRGTIINQII